MQALSHFILSYPRTILVAIVILAASAVFPSLNIRTDFNLEGFFPENAPTIEEYRRLAEEFGRDDTVIGVAFEVPDVLEKQLLLDLYTITEQLRGIENVSDVISLWTINKFENEDGVLVTEPYLDFDNIMLSGHFDEDGTLRNRLLSDPFVKNVIISENASVTAFYIELDEELNSYTVRNQVIADLEAVLMPFRSSYDFKIAGIPYFRNQYVHMLNSEIIMYISISSVLIIGLLWGLFRNLRGVVIPIGIVWLTILFTVAVIVMTGGYFEILSSSIAPILLCVGVADSIHLLTKYQDARINGLNQKDALRDTIIILGTATLLTSVTTAIGFGTLLSSNVIPMRRFGVYAAAGVLIAFLITIFLLPSILPYFKESQKPSEKNTRVHRWIGHFLRRTYSGTMRYHKVIVVFTALLTLIFAYGATLLKVNGKIFDDVGKNTTVMQHSDFFSEKLIPQFPLEFVIDTGVENGAFSPEVLRDIVRFEEYLTQFDEIERTISLTTLIKRIHETMSPEEAAITPIPDNPALIAQYMFLLELSDPEAAQPVVDFNYQTIRLASNVQDMGSWRMNQIRDEIEIWLKDAFPNETVYISGTSILVADLTANIVQSLSSSILLAFFFIALLMSWLFKDPKLVIISLLPNIIPLLITAGFMGYFGIDIKPSTAVIFTIAFGIAVDDSIHYLARLKIEMQRQSSLADAVFVTTEKTGRAIILTSIILITGFGTLATSAFTSTMLMGTLTCLTIVTALLADIFFLPALLTWMKPKFNGNQ